MLMNYSQRGEYRMKTPLFSFHIMYLIVSNARINVMFVYCPAEDLKQMFHIDFSIEYLNIYENIRFIENDFLNLSSNCHFLRNKIGEK